MVLRKIEGAECALEKMGFRVVESVENRTWSVDGIPLDEIKMELTLHNSVI